MNKQERKLFRAANEKFMRGDSLTNSEVQNLHSFYRDLYKALGVLGAEFRLSANEAMHRFYRLDDYLGARKLKAL